ncbi:MAG TPA: M48 family metallopeptidase [Kiloniellales bacterium]|nr:M48 family metallopeptidase [Kiloniellales bacterium]
MCGADRLLFSRRAMLAGLGAGSLVMLTGCAENPHLGRQQLILVDEGQLNQMGVAAWRDIRQQERLSRSPQLNRRIETIGTRIVQAAGLEDRYDWEYAVFDNEQANAFALPGGKIGVNTGLIRLARNDDEIAAVVGHEVAHVTSRHSAERVSQSMASEIGLSLAQMGLGGGETAAALLGAGLQYGILLPYSRRQEYEADRLGLRYAAAAGYDPRAAISFWQTMTQQAQRGQPPEFLSTHPADANRIAALHQELQAMGY